MLAMEMPLGHSASHSLWLVQLPKPRASMRATMDKARRAASGCPWGSKRQLGDLGAQNSMAEALGQAATQAPQPMQAAASMARSASLLGTGSELASGA